ncbi:MAG: helix-turn-helix domain-containing protein [Anaerolineales bacterium]|nr:helix-turn-helix domain-containing protein [Anaerolineales bacterium]
MPKDTPEKVLQKWVKQKGWTAADLAAASGMGYQHCWNLLNNKSRLTDETLGRLTRTLLDADLTMALARAMKAAGYGNGNGKGESK